MSLSNLVPRIAIAVSQDKEELLNGFVDDRTHHTTISDIEERIENAFEEVSKHGYESGDLAVANFVWETEFPPSGKITVDPEQDDGDVLLRVHLREDSAAVDVGYPVGYRGSCVYVGRRSDVLDAIHEIVSWEETTEASGDILERHLS
ncbi:hypothetical protein SAMN04489841_3947 [Natrinema salaciae]|uniref:Uncharacterized protein n=1 Tax=Natrinema salaciae TaxID=1186196 RepID=A0A1H9PQH9_9EURY|nr:hypothetical protein SAMN04489841_3947 [Natrinema salaciae]